MRGLKVSGCRAGGICTNAEGGSCLLLPETGVSQGLSSGDHSGWSLPVLLWGHLEGTLQIQSQVLSGGTSLQL